MLYRNGMKSKSKSGKIEGVCWIRRKVKNTKKRFFSPNKNINFYADKSIFNVTLFLQLFLVNKFKFSNEKALKEKKLQRKVIK